MGSAPDTAAASEPAPAMEPRTRRRRWPWVAGGVVVVLAGAAAFLWFVWFPNHRPSLEAGERYGVDVSHHQGHVNWNRVATDDISFAYIKASEGGDFTDPLFRENRLGAARAGLPWGAYHFFTLCTPGRAQAERFLRVVPAGAEMLPPAVDLETQGNCDARPDPHLVRRELGTFARTVEAATGLPVVLYVNHSLEARLDRANALPSGPRWARSILGRPDPGWAIWQANGMANVDGVATPVDLDVMSADFARRWGVARR